MDWLHAVGFVLVVLLFCAVSMGRPVWAAIWLVGALEAFLLTDWVLGLIRSGPGWSAIAAVVYLGVGLLVLKTRWRDLQRAAPARSAPNRPRDAELMLLTILLYWPIDGFLRVIDNSWKWVLDDWLKAPEPSAHGTSGSSVATGTDTVESSGNSK